MNSLKNSFTAYTWRHQHLGRLLFELQKDFQLRSIEHIKTLGYTDISIANINIIASTDVEGTRLSSIAKNLDISKQAAGQMAKELIDKGYLQRQEDPTDGRATLISFTAKGKTLLDDAKKGIDEIEALYANILGQAPLRALKAELSTLLENIAKEQP